MKCRPDINSKVTRARMEEIIYEEDRMDRGEEDFQDDYREHYPGIVRYIWTCI